MSSRISNELVERLLGDHRPFSKDEEEAAAMMVVAHLQRRLRGGFTTQFWAPTIVGTGKVKHPTSTELRTYAFLKGEITDDTPLGDVLQVRREMWLIFTADSGASLDFGAPLGAQKIGAYWDRMPATGFGQVPKDQFGDEDDESRFVVVNTAPTYSFAELVNQVARVPEARAHLRLVDGTITLWKRWPSALTIAPIVQGRVERCRLESTGALTPRKNYAHLLALPEAAGSSGNPRCTWEYRSHYLFRDGDFPELSGDPKTARPVTIENSIPPYANVTENDWLAWVKQSLGDPGVDRQRWADCNVRIYDGAQLTAYLDHVAQHNALPPF